METDNANTLLASLYTISDPSSSNETATTLATQHLEIAATIKSGILDLFWDAEKLAFYDYNLTSEAYVVSLPPFIHRRGETRIV